MNQILIKQETLKPAKRKDLVRNSGTKLTRENKDWCEDGYYYCDDSPRPTEAPEDGYRWQRAEQATEQAYGWQQVAILVIVPDRVSMAQFQEEISKPTYNNETGVSLLDIVDGAVSTQDQQMKIWWAKASEVDRDNAKVLTMAQALGVSNETLDAIFIGAILN